jgi:phosphopantetheinyl transferase
MGALSKNESWRREPPLDVVDLWFARLPEINRSLEALLSVEEMRRAMRFRFDRDAANFVVRRALLRIILANYTGIQPSKLTFTYSPFGKPALDQNVYSLRFSLSHSGELAVYAVSRGRDIGVDIERLQQTILEVPMIAEPFFSEAEITSLNDTAADQREERFLSLWTQLEARGKAAGTGMVSPSFAGTKVFLGKCFSFTRMFPSPGYVVALAVQGRRRCSLRTVGFHIPANRIELRGVTLCN